MRLKTAPISGTMSSPDIHTISRKVLDMLEGLSPHLTYHCIGHTKDVVRQSERIALEENISGHELFLLHVAALYHDTGFVEAYLQHEEKSCALFLQDNEMYGFPPHDVEIIIGLIMATQVPQMPQTHLQRIICDADLDYLGRDDFDAISEQLKKEFLHFGIVADEVAWQEMQVKFLTAHHYHTGSSRKHREPVKQTNLAGLQ